MSINLLDLTCEHCDSGVEEASNWHHFISLFYCGYCSLSLAAIQRRTQYDFSTYCIIYWSNMDACMLVWLRVDNLENLQSEFSGNILQVQNLITNLNVMHRLACFLDEFAAFDFGFPMISKSR